MGQINNDPHQRLESLERWSGRATLIILVGIVLEIFSLFWAPHTTWDRTTGTIANLLIGAGLIIEYVVIGRAIVASGEANRLSDEKVAEANAAAEQANKDAAEARERTAEIEKLTAWRQISPENRSAIIQKITELADGMDFAIEYQYGDIEALMYSRSIGQMFFEAGLKTIRSNPNSFLSDIFGSIIASSTDEYLPIVKAFIDADHTFAHDKNMDLSRHFPANVPAPNLYIFIAPKLPLIFEGPARESST